MKISNPFGLNGHLEVKAAYIVKPKVGAIAVTSAGKGTATVPIARTSEPFKVMINVQFAYDVYVGKSKNPPLMVGEGNFEVLATWNANFDEDGLDLQHAGDPPRGSAKSEGPIKVSLAGAVPSQSPTKSKKPFVTWEATLVAVLTEEGVGIGIGPASVDVFGGDSRSEALPLEFTLHLDVEKAPEKKTPSIKTMAFKIGPYPHRGTKTDSVKTSTFSDYWTWSKFREEINGLPTETKAEWTGSDPKFLRPRSIRIVGYTDTTGPMSENDSKYGMGRAEDAKRWIQRWTGAGSEFFVVRTEGEGKGGTDKKADEKKLARNRYVAVELSYITD